MIRQTTPEDFADIYRIINDAAIAYKGIIPKDRWCEPYMSEMELQQQISEGISFTAYTDPIDGSLNAVMGIQDKEDVSLIRHAYVETTKRNAGIGGLLIQALIDNSEKPVLVGTWKAATWAIRFYEKHGFTLVSDKVKTQLLNQYWNIPQRQIETSVVLVDKLFRAN